MIDDMQVAGTVWLEAKNGAWLEKRRTHSEIYFCTHCLTVLLLHGLLFYRVNVKNSRFQARMRCYDLL